MSQRPFRFLHASDLHLERPFCGLDDAPDHLTDLLVDCPLLAATRMFDAAIAERVDFVVLAGDVINPAACGPRELLFLVEQFNRLAEQRIAVYWTAGEIESAARFPKFIQWPTNVRRFTGDDVERYRHESGGEVLCDIFSCESMALLRGSDSRTLETGLFSIGVMHSDDGEIDRLAAAGINYWALGENHARGTPLTGTTVVHHSGSPQARCRADLGPHGCTIVDVDGEQRAQLRFVECDVIRAHAPLIQVGESDDPVAIERILLGRGDLVRTQNSSTTNLVTWHLACHSKSLSSLRHGTLATDLKNQLNSKFSSSKPALWTIAVESQPSESVPAAWREEDSLRGSFLRALEEKQRGNAPFVETSMPEEFRNQISAADFDNDDCNGERLLQEVAWLGAELLSPEEMAP